MIKYDMIYVISTEGSSSSSIRSRWKVEYYIISYYIYYIAVLGCDRVKKREVDIER